MNEARSDIGHDLPDFLPIEHKHKRKEGSHKVCEQDCYEGTHFHKDRGHNLGSC